MTPKLNRRRKLLALCATLLVTAGVAYAYWTTTGSGTGSASTGNAAAITVNQTSTPSGLYPGGPTAALSGNFNNPNSGPAYVGSVDAAISSVTGPNIDGTHPCTASDYQLNGFPVSVNAQVAAGNGVGSWSGASIQLLNSGSNQDGCKGATVNLSYTSD